MNQDTTIFILILCGGNGSRFSSTKKKQFADLKGLPVFLWSIKFFLRDLKIFKDLHCSLIYSQGDFELFQELSKKYLFDEERSRIHYIEGGETRNESVYFGLKSLSKLAKPKDIVLIHDGARPLIKELDIINLMEGLKSYSAVSLGYKPTDTIKVINPKNEELVKNLYRDDLRNMQTPQGFHFFHLWEAYKDYEKFNFTTTDDTELIHKLGYPVKIILGDPGNIKITVLKDLKYAEVNLVEEL